MTQASAPNPLKARLLAMMVLRVVLALAFLGVTTWFQIRQQSLTQHNFYPLYGVVVLVGLLTIAYALLLNRARNLPVFAYAQVTADIALVTAIVYVTGGIESYLQTLYLLTVIGSSILLGRHGGYWSASASSIAYGVLIDMDFYGMLPARFKVFGEHMAPAWEDVLTTVSTNILAFFTVAYLTGYLAERTARVEKRLVEKEIDFEKLEVLNRQIVENISSGIMTLDGTGSVTSFNAAAESITGYTFKEVYRKNVDEIFEGMFLRGAEPPQGGLRFEKLFRRKNGTELHLGFTVSEGQGGDVSAIVIFQDLTQLKAMEEQLRRDEKLKALGELSVGIAHEIRNPLASISGSIQVLKTELDLESENTRLMEIVLRETERLDSLITDFLLFAKPAREKRERIDLTSVMNETLDMFRNCPEASGVRIESAVDSGLAIEGDARQIGQVLWNLFINAAHAMPGGGRLVVSASATYSPGAGPDNTADFKRQGEAGKGRAVEGHSVEIRIADNGTGIPPENLTRIFDPFFSTKERGTGLGLAIVHRIIESHGGSVRVASKPGEGTVFKIVLPLAAEPAVS